MQMQHPPRVRRPLIEELSSTEAPDDEGISAREAEAVPEGQHAVLELPSSRRADQTPAAVHAALAAQHAVPTPSASVFADVDAATDSSPAGAEVQRHCAAAAAALRELATRLTVLAPADIDYGTEAASTALAAGSAPTAAAPAQPEADRRGLRPGVLIEEVTQDAQLDPEPERLLAAEVVLLCGMYAHDDTLAGSWVTAETSTAGRDVLESLVSLQSTAQNKQNGATVRGEELGYSPSTPAAVGHDGASAALQRLILRVVPDVLRLLRPILGKPKEVRRKVQSAAYMPPMSFDKGEQVAVVRQTVTTRGVWIAAAQTFKCSRRG